MRGSRRTGGLEHAAARRRAVAPSLRARRGAGRHRARGGALGGAAELVARRTRRDGGRTRREPARACCGYLVLGIEHIATGYDHIAFVLALLLLAASLREVAGLVTGFTIGHSLTLALAVLGVVRPEPAAIEALIGFSIALVAAENAWLLGGRPRAVPWLLVAGLAALAAAAFAGYRRRRGVHAARPRALLVVSLRTSRAQLATGPGARRRRLRVRTRPRLRLRGGPRRDGVCRPTGSSRRSSGSTRGSKWVSSRWSR